MTKTQEPLVRVTKYNNNVRELGVLKRIVVDYPILVREEVAKKLAKAARKLPNNIVLQVDSGHRTKEIQKLVWEFRYKQLRSENKDLPARKIHSLTRKLVFDPAKGIPPHTTGGAVDISLVDRNGKEINLSSPFKKFYSEPQLRSSKITPRAQELRSLLNKLMKKEGFAPNAREYWHFSYGDKAWAKTYDKRVLYSKVAVPETLYYPFYLRIISRVIRILFRILNKAFKIDTSY